jgi:hypothetical protein
MGAAMDMKFEHRKIVMKMLVALAEFFRQDLGAQPKRLAAYADALEDISLEQLARAQKRAQRECKFFPMPAELRELAEGNAKDRVKDDALDAANRVIVELGKNQSGYHLNGAEYDAFLAKVRANVGELGWEAIRSLGGWAKIYQEFTDSKPGYFRTQLQQICEAIYRRASAGTHTQAPRLPAPDRSGLTAIKGLLPDHMKDRK